MSGREKEREREVHAMRYGKSGKNKLFGGMRTGFKYRGEERERRDDTSAYSMTEQTHADLMSLDITY